MRRNGRRKEGGGGGDVDEGERGVQTGGREKKDDDHDLVESESDVSRQDVSARKRHTSEVASLSLPTHIGMLRAARRSGEGQKGRPRPVRSSRRLSDAIADGRGGVAVTVHRSSTTYDRYSPRPPRTAPPPPPSRPAPAFQPGDSPTTYQIVGWVGWTAPHPPPRDGRCRRRPALVSVAPSPCPSTRRRDGQGRARRTRGGAARTPDGRDLSGGRAHGRHGRKQGKLLPWGVAAPCA